MEIANIEILFYEHSVANLFSKWIKLVTLTMFISFSSCDLLSCCHINVGYIKDYFSKIGNTLHFTVRNSAQNDFTGKRDIYLVAY